MSLPTGVNIASWLSLEDWFFVGTNGAVEVASPDDATAAACLPPLHLDASTGPRWNSETDLLAGLAEHYRQEEEGGDSGGQTLGGYPNAREKSLGGGGGRPSGRCTRFDRRTSTWTASCGRWPSWA